MTARAHVLVVDDDETVRRSYSAILAGGQCDAQMASDGTEALAAMEHQPFDLVLLDLRMPGPDGISVLKTLKQRWPESEVIVITGYPSVETAKEAVRLGAFEYLAKPAWPDDIVAAARGALNHKQFALRQKMANY
jgi:DNA-binding NtrC family response regulator